MNRIQQQPAYVLHARAFRETSLIVEVITRDYGRAAMVARGAKSPKSKWRSLLQPFRPLLISWNARNELGTLTAADQVASPPGLHEEALYCGMYLNELLLRLLHRNDPHPEVFERYRQVLSGLSSGESMQALLRVFEKHLLDSIGYGLILDHEIRTGEVLRDEAWYEYHPDRGPCCISIQNAPTRRLISGKALRALQEEYFDEESLLQLKNTMRRVIRHHLGSKPLKSVELFGVY